MTSKLQDHNRIRKNYPLLRVKPVYKGCFSAEEIENMTGIDVETAIISFTNEHQKDYDFTKTYTEIPVIALTPEDENVNIFVTSLNTGKMTIESSAPFTGKVHIQVFKAS
jgi:hypothetical protein